MFTKDEIKKMMAIGLMCVGLIIVYQLLANFSATIEFIQMGITILSPITIAFIIFYVINIPMKSIERTLFKSEKIPKKVKRALALLVTLLSFGTFFLVFFLFAVPQLVDSLNRLIEQIPDYAKEVRAFVEAQFAALNLSNDIISAAETMWTNFLGTFANIMLSIADSTGGFVSNFITGVFTAIISSVLAVYMLIGKEDIAGIISKLWRAYSPKKITAPAIKYLDIVNNSFEHFIRGQLIEALILGIICYIGMLIFRFEYALLISFFVGITNIIPLFGPYIGAVPSFFLLLMVNPVSALWFLLYLIVLQQLEANLIYPKVVGSSMGISGFFILVAVIVGNSLFGIAGILFGIPLLSSFYVILKEATDKRLKED